MPFIPHTEDDVHAMLETIGARRIEDLFDEIPAELKSSGLPNVPPGMNEMQVGRLMRQRAAQDGQPLCFIGAGAYAHHIPAAVWELTTRGEYYTAYTPYQAEASQGTLQLLYEYQTMMTSLTGLDVSNASMYDGASALAEAVLMAVRVNRKSKSKRVLMPVAIHPAYRAATRAIVTNQGIELVDVPYDRATGATDVTALARFAGQDFAALAIPQPNFFGVIENVDALTDWAHQNNAIAIGVVNPTALAILKPPGQWGTKGADVACGDGQPLGAPLSSGGPYFGFMCCKQEHVRQMPGRIVGRTVDLDGKPGFTLTLQAREQHIRRSKATSNICTNQGLLVTAATIYMSLLGVEGLERVAQQCHANTLMLLKSLTSVGNVRRVFSGPVFHEAVIQLPAPVAAILEQLARKHTLGGYDLTQEYPELGNALLVCATEVHAEEDIESFSTSLRAVLAR